MTYLLDTNIFIQAKNCHYGFDFCPAFWEWLIGKNNEGLVGSIESVNNELQAGDDDLKSWAKGQGEYFFLKPDAAVFPALSAVSEWATSQNFSPAAISVFLNGADCWLVAHALAHGFVVISAEMPSPPGTRKTIKIPDACTAFQVPFMSVYEMLRRERARFVLGAGPREL